MIKPIIYTTPSCTYCTTIKNWFRDHQVEYQEVTVGVDIPSDVFIDKTGSMGVPVTEINGEFIVGFQPDRLSQLIA